MKISLGRRVNKKKGMDFFLDELVSEFSKYKNVKIVDETAKSDIHLSIIEGYKHKCKNVLRLDGVYYDIPRLHLNNSIRHSMKQADGIIFQSEWCRTFTKKMLQYEHPRSVVIYNGVNQSNYKQKTQINKRGYDRLFISCALWRPNKRPEAIAESFVLASGRFCNRTGLLMVGKIAQEMKVNYKDIHYLGNVEHKQLVGLYNSSDYMVHICHVDACPNAVIEAMSSGLPVLCNNIGGTPEVVGKSGIIVNLDTPFKFNPVQNIEEVGSKKININILADGMLKISNQTWDVNRVDLDISNISLKYYNFFLDVLEK